MASKDDHTSSHPKLVASSDTIMRSVPRHTRVGVSYYYRAHGNFHRAAPRDLAENYLLDLAEDDMVWTAKHIYMSLAQIFHDYYRENSFPPSYHTIFDCELG